jgi:hypothetical protein
MIPLAVVMLDVRRNRSPKMAFPERDDTTSSLIERTNRSA